MEYHPSKKHIKASITPENILQNIPPDITIPFFIEYGALYPYILYIFKRVDNQLHFIQKDELEPLFETFFSPPTDFFHHHTIFYEIQNKSSPIPLDLSGTLYTESTILWFASPYELYTNKKVFNTPFADDVIQFFLDNPSLGELYWDHVKQPSPIIAYSQDTLRKTIFQSTFGADFSRTPPHFSLLKEIVNPLLPTVRYSLFYPYTEKDNILSFIQHNQHTPICYVSDNTFLEEKYTEYDDDFTP
jgi:hypothetical protein